MWKIIYIAPVGSILSRNGHHNIYWSFRHLRKALQALRLDHWEQGWARIKFNGLTLDEVRCDLSFRAQRMARVLWVWHGHGSGRWRLQHHLRDSWLCYKINPAKSASCLVLRRVQGTSNSLQRVPHPEFWRSPGHRRRESDSHEE